MLCWARGLHFESSICYLLFLKIGVGESTLFASLCAVRPVAEGSVGFSNTVVWLPLSNIAPVLCRFVHTMQVARLEHSVCPVMQLSLQ